MLIIKDDHNRLDEMLDYLSFCRFTYALKSEWENLGHYFYKITYNGNLHVIFSFLPLHFFIISMNYIRKGEKILSASFTALDYIGKKLNISLFDLY